MLRNAGSTAPGPATVLGHATKDMHVNDKDMFWLLLCWLTTTEGIVENTTRAPALDAATYFRRPNDLGPTTWYAGVNCIDRFTHIFFRRRPGERYTRAYNMVLTNVFNMSTPAAQIQNGFIARINEAVSEQPPTPPRDDLFQLRVVSDRSLYQMKKPAGRELLLADYYVIVVDSVAGLQSLMRNNVSRTRSWNPGARFIVLFNHPQLREHSREIAVQIFTELMYKFFVYRVALLYAVHPTQYVFLVNDYYSNVDCRILRVQEVGACHQGTLYPDEPTVETKMTEYLNGFSPQNCTFYVCASIAAPFVEEDCVHGIEMRTLHVMRNRLHFQINQTCSNATRGVLSKSGRWTGLLGKLNEGECDFIMGGFYPDNDVSEYFWGSDCYLTDSHTFFVKLAEKRAPWKAMVAIFEYSTWIAFFVVLVFCWLFWYALTVALPEPTYYQEFALTAINAFAVSICQAIYERPLCHATRILFLMLSIYGLNVVSTYNSKMIATFQHPGYEHQIDTITEVRDEYIPFGGSEESHDWFDNEEDKWIYENYNDTDEFDPTYENLLTVKYGQRVILSSRMFIQQSNLSDSVYAFPDNMFNSPIQMIMKAGFPFLFDMNTIIRLMRDMGIFTKIYNEFYYSNTYLNRIAIMRPHFEETAIVLTTAHLQGPFVLLVAGIGCAALTFVGELVLHWGLVPVMAHAIGRLRTKAMPTKKPKESHATRHMQKSRRVKTHRGKEVVEVVREIRFTPMKRRKVL